MNLLVILISLIIIIVIFYYFNFYRYFNIRYIQNNNNSIKNYAKLDRIKCSSKIIVSMSCRPSNINEIKPMLISLLEQTIKIDEIVLNIPYTTNGGETYIVDKENEKIVNVYRCGADYETENNIIPTLLREGEYGTIIIVLDENVIYGQTFLETLLKKSLENNNCAILFNEGMLVKPEFFRKEILYDEKITNSRKYINATKIMLEYFENYRM